MKTRERDRIGLHGRSESSREPARVMRRTAPPWAAALAIVAITAVAYLPAMRAGYVWDDDQHVEQNQTLRSVGGLGRIWFDVGATHQYYPLVHTSFWIEYRAWGLDPAGYHMVNILLHAISAVLLWRVLTLLQVRGAWLAAAVFALHPVNVESVAWITERKNVLSGVFYLAAALAYLTYALTPGRASTHASPTSGRHRPGDRLSSRSSAKLEDAAHAAISTRSKAFYAAALAFFACALLSKTVTSTLPAALLLVLWWKRGSVRWPDARALAPLFAVGLAFGLFTIWVEKHHVGAGGEPWDLSPVERGLIAGRGLWFYAGKLLWPVRLTFIYPRWEIDAQALRQYLFPAAAAATAVVLWLGRRRTGSGPLAAVLFFAGTLFPALGFFDVYPMRYSFVADHFQYLAGAGIIALVVAVGYRIADRLGGLLKRIAPVSGVLVLGVLGTLTWRQARVYSNRETLWRDTLRKNSNCWIAHNNLGMVLQSQGRLDEAISHYRRAIQVTPAFAVNAASSHLNIGKTYAAQRRYDEAISEYEQSLRLMPDFAIAHYNMGIALRARGRLDEAIRHYRRALEMKPDLAEAHTNLGNALVAQGRTDEAIGEYRKALRINANLLEAHMNLGAVLSRTGRPSEALRHLRQAARLKPGWPAPLRSMAWIMATSPNADVRDGDTAIQLARRAAELAKPDDADTLDTLAAAYAQAGQFERAVATAEAALAATAGSGKRRLADRIRGRVELYRRKLPYREP